MHARDKPKQLIRSKRESGIRPRSAVKEKKSKKGQRVGMGNFSEGKRTVLGGERFTNLVKS